MPRGRKPKTVSLDQQISETEVQIQEYQELLKEAKSKLKALMAQKKQQDVNTLYEFISDKGLSPEDCVKIIQEKLD